MIIDLRKTFTQWINLDEHTENASSMEKQFSELGFKRTQRVSAAKIPAPPNANPAFGTHYMGCGTSHIRCFENITEYPSLILEDDALATEDFSPIISVPDDADAIYLGISNGNPNTIAIDLRTDAERVNNSQGWARISNMLATHSILYITPRYTKIAEYSTKHSINELKMPLDMGFAFLQDKFNIYAAIKPFFIQSDERQSANKWEFFTKSLRLTGISPHPIQSQL